MYPLTPAQRAFIVPSTNVSVCPQMVVAHSAMIAAPKNSAFPSAKTSASAYLSAKLQMATIAAKTAMLMTIASPVHGVSAPMVIAYASVV
jgi:hypothetical protein